MFNPIAARKPPVTEKHSPERPDAGLQRILKFAIVAMGLMIAAGLGAVIFRLVQLSPQPSASSAPSARTLVLPDGGAVRSLSLSGEKLAVHYSAPGGEGIALVDTETGRVLSRIRVVPKTMAE